MKGCTIPNATDAKLMDNLTAGLRGACEPSVQPTSSSARPSPSRQALCHQASEWLRAPRWRQRQRSP